MELSLDVVFRAIAALVQRKNDGACLLVASPSGVLRCGWTRLAKEPDDGVRLATVIFYLVTFVCTDHIDV